MTSKHEDLEPTEDVGNVNEINDDPHADENPEDHIGDETPDPWDDPEQLDWPGDDTETD